MIPKKTAYERFFEIDTEIAPLKENLEWLRACDRWVSSQDLNTDLEKVSVKTGGAERQLHPIIIKAVTEAREWYRDKRPRKRAVRFSDLQEEEDFQEFWSSLEDVTQLVEETSSAVKLIKSLELEQKTISQEAASFIKEEPDYVEIVRTRTRDYLSLGLSAQHYAEASVLRYKKAFEKVGLKQVRIEEREDEYIVSVKCLPQEKRILRNIEPVPYEEILQSRNLCVGVAEKFISEVVKSPLGEV